MSTQGRLIWQGYLVEWKHEMFKSKRDLTYHPHFILKVSDETSDITISYDNVQINDNDLKKCQDFTKLPSEIIKKCLDQLIDTLEKEKGK
ncbi:MAG TPA: hypothetical protein VJ836_00730 [Candidatus Saccharimonadales bacterium]|nr:hypothetical protein [Candidatus Saccharimonadales bacterium]